MNLKIVSFSENDKQMSFAIKEAKRSLKTFFDAYSNPKDNQTSFLLKVEFVENEEVEHIWVADIDATLFPPTGTIANDPNLPGLLFMQRVEFHPSQISDWMYVEDGYIVGGFTIQVIRSLLSEAERAEYDANAPYKFNN